MWTGDNPWGAVNQRRGPVTGQQAAQTAGELVRGEAEVQGTRSALHKELGWGEGTLLRVIWEGRELNSVCGHHVGENPSAPGCWVNRSQGVPPAKELQKGSACKSWSNCSHPRETPKQKYWLTVRRERTE